MKILKNIKKATLGILGVAILTTGIVACNSDDSGKQDIINEEIKSNTNELFVNLNNYNKKLNYDKDSRTTYGWGDDLLNWVGVAGGDLVGAAAGAGSVQALAVTVGAATEGVGYVVVSGVGAVIGGVGGSRVAYCTVYPDNCSKKKNKSSSSNSFGKSVVFNLPEPYKHIEKLGQLHNNMLENVYMYSDSNETEISWLSKNIPNIDVIDYQKLYNSNEFKKVMGDIEEMSNNYALNNYSIETLLDSCRQKGYITENVSEVLNLYFNGLKRCEKFTDIEEITEYYVGETLDSHLTQIEKEELLSAFSVGVQSIYFWGNFENN